MSWSIKMFTMYAYSISNSLSDTLNIFIFHKESKPSKSTEFMTHMTHFISK
jgi:hypothetical protein